MVFSEDGGPSTVDQFLLLLRTPYLLSPITFSHKPRSRIKSGMTELGDWHNVTSCHSELVSESRRFFRVTRMLSLRERKTTQQSTLDVSFESPACFPSENGEPINGQPVSLALTNPLPATTDNGFSKFTPTP